MLDAVCRILVRESNVVLFLVECSINFQTNSANLDNQTKKCKTKKYKKTKVASLIFLSYIFLSDYLSSPNLFENLCYILLASIAIASKKKKLVNCRVNCQFALLPVDAHQGKQRKLTVYATVPQRSFLAFSLD